MKFPNSFKGVKKIWLAEILMLFAAVLGIIAAVVVALNATVDGDAVTMSEGIAATTGIIVLVTALVALIAFILNLVGLINCRKDDDAFNIALIVTLVGLAASVVSSIWSKNEVLTKWISVVTTLCSLFASYYVLTGIANLSDAYPDAATKALCEKSRMWLMWSFCASSVFKFIINIFNLQDGTTIHTIITVVALVLELISYVLYLRALAKGKDMLAR